MATPEAWDGRYKGEDFAYGRTPNDFLKEKVNTNVAGEGKRALCIADGEGRNGMYLLSLGYSVTSMDFSPVGMQKMRKWAEEEGVSDRLTTQVCDLETYDFEENAYDVIASIYCHTPVPLRKQIHARLASTLKPGGIFVQEVYHPNNIGRGTGGPQAVDLCQTPDDIRDELVGLEIILLQDLEREVNEGHLHKGLAAVTQLVAKRP